jgi:hypothetical protein
MSVDTFSVFVEVSGGMVQSRSHLSGLPSDHFDLLIRIQLVMGRISSNKGLVSTKMPNEQKLQHNQADNRVENANGRLVFGRCLGRNDANTIT